VTAVGSVVDTALTAATPSPRTSPRRRLVGRFLGRGGLTTWTSSGSWSTWWQGPVFVISTGGLCVSFQTP